MSNSPAEAFRPQPFLKWAGGKRALLPAILPKIPKISGRYIEPFLGAGAVFFSIDSGVPKLVNDSNSDLIEVYEVVRDSVEELISELRSHINDKDYFLRIRAWDRADDFLSRTSVERAARFIYLNKTCFNGLYRVNGKGYFNVPFAGNKNPDFISAENLIAVSAFLSQIDLTTTSGRLVEFMSGDYRIATSQATSSDFVYFDPPYDPVSLSSSFVAYQKGGFGRENQSELRDEAVRLTKLGVPILVSNSETEFILDLYSNSSMFSITRVETRRVISAKSSGRGTITEILVDNHAAIEKLNGKD